MACFANWRWLRLATSVSVLKWGCETIFFGIWVGGRFARRDCGADFIVEFDKSDVYRFYRRFTGFREYLSHNLFGNTFVRAIVSAILQSIASAAQKRFERGKSARHRSADYRRGRDFEFYTDFLYFYGFDPATESDQRIIVACV